MRARLGGAVLGLVLAAGSPASADVLILRNGDLVQGRLATDELPVATSTGVTRLRVGEVRQVLLDTLEGDVITLRSGARVTGSLDLPALVVRLDAGPDFAVARHRVHELYLLPR